MTAGPAPLLQVRDLRVWFRLPGGIARAVDGVSFTVRRGETVGLVGESGCGKSVTAMRLLGLVPMPPATDAGGEAWFEGRDLLKLPPRELRRLSGDRISMIFQEPMTSLNPVFTIGDQVAEVWRMHRGARRRDAWDRAVALLHRVGIPAATERARDFPHHLSGGMRQRVMIAMALACDPDLLLADEPTTALDVTIQAQILDLLAQIRADTGMGVLLITHDLGVVEEVCDRVVVMYAGKVVEEGDVTQVFERPLHPYTVGLFGSLPGREGASRRRLRVISGVVPPPLEFPTGCRFRNRCPLVLPECADGEPPLALDGRGHGVACLRAGEATP